MTRSQSLRIRALAFRKLAILCEIMADYHQPIKKRPTQKERKQAGIDSLISRVQSGKHRGRPRNS